MIFTAFFNLIVLCLIFLLIFFIFKVTKRKQVFKAGYPFKKHRIIPIYIGILVVVALVFQFIMPYFQENVLSEITQQSELNEIYPLEVMSDEVKAEYMITEDKLTIEDGQVVLKLQAGEESPIIPIKIIEDEDLNEEAYARFYEVPGVIEINGKSYRFETIQSIEAKENVIEVTPPDFIHQEFKVIQGDMFSRVGEDQSRGFGFSSGHDLIEIVVPKTVEVVYDENEFYYTNDPG